VLLDPAESEAERIALLPGLRIKMKGAKVDVGDFEKGVAIHAMLPEKTFIADCEQVVRIVLFDPAAYLAHPFE